MSVMKQIAERTIVLINNSVDPNSIDPMVVKTVKTKSHVSELIATVGPGNQVSLVAKHSESYGKESLITILPLSQDDVPSMTTFLTAFLQGHKDLSKSH